MSWNVGICDKVYPIDAGNVRSRETALLGFHLIRDFKAETQARVLGHPPGDPGPRLRVLRHPAVHVSGLAASIVILLCDEVGQGNILSDNTQIWDKKNV